MNRRIATFAGALALCCAGAAAAAPGEITIEGSRVFPESIAADKAGNIYATSLDGTVYRAPAGSDKAVAWIKPDERNGLLWSMGVLAHDASNTLYVCSTAAGFATPPRLGDAALVTFDLKTGELKARYVLPKPAEGSAMCNDVAVGQYGKVYITDTAGGRLYSIAANANEAKLEAADPLLMGVEGPAFSDDNKLYLNNTRNNLILRVERTAQGAFTGLTKIETSIPLSGADGFRHWKGNQFLQAETGGIGRITLVSITGDKAEVKVLADGTGSAGVTFVGDTAYAAEGKIGYLFDPKLKDQSPDPFVIKPIPIGDGQ